MFVYAYANVHRQMDGTGGVLVEISVGVVLLNKRNEETLRRSSDLIGVLVMFPRIKRRYRYIGFKWLSYYSTPH